MTLTDCQHVGYDASKPFDATQVCTLCKRHVKLKNFTDLIPTTILIRCPTCLKLVVGINGTALVARHGDCKGQGLQGSHQDLQRKSR